MKIEDKFTGETFNTENSNSRLVRLSKRVRAFGDALDHLRQSQDFILKMITLTYAPDNSWEKNQIRTFMKSLRGVVRESLFAYGWVAELQKRGAVHYHVYCAVTPGTVIPQPDSSGMWPYGFSRVETGNSPYYLLSYASKKYQKVGKFPKGMRMLHVWIRKGLLPKLERWVFDLSAYPNWLTDQLLASGSSYVGNLPRRHINGGWKVKHTRSIPNHEIWVYFPSPYRVVHMGEYAPAYEMAWLDE